MSATKKARRDEAPKQQGAQKWRSTALTGPLDRQAEAYPRRIAARAMLRATGFKDDDFAKPIITVAVTYTNATPCNHHIREMGDIVAKQIEELGGKPFIFGTPVVSDGETTGIKVTNVLCVLILANAQLIACVHAFLDLERA